MVDLADADVLAILTRAPSSGGKSRLFAALGRPVDRALLEALLFDTIDGAAGPGITVVLSVSGDDERQPLRAKLASIRPDIHVMAQPPGDLGARMRGTMAHLFMAGAARVVLIGSDLPAITSAPIGEAFERLADEPQSLVLGPALDGGYYLIAATMVPPVFERIEWGSGDVLAQTCAAAIAAGLRIHFLEPMGDVDSVADLRSLPAAARRTRAWWLANG